MVGFGQIQEGVLDVLFNYSERHDQVTVVNGLIQDAYSLRPRMEEIQSQAPYRDTVYEWTAIEFGYYALLTSLLHLNQRVLGPLTRNECLKASRQSLNCLKNMQEEIAMDANFLDEYPYFMTWTLLFFPLSPFFVLFCNVVRIQDDSDYTLMAAVIEGMARFTTRSASIAALHKLFSVFLRLCDPLMRNNPDASLRSIPESSAALENGVSNLAGTLGASPATISDTLLGSNLPQSGEAMLEDPMIDNDLTWSLFDSQPWLGWIRSDVLEDPSMMTQP